MKDVLLKKLDIFRKQPFELKLLLLVFIAIIFTILINAWLCDDAYITFRVVDNFTHGYGLRWNTFERVQAYSNPLLMLCISCISFFTGEVYFTSIFFSIIVSCIAIYILLFKISKNYILSIGLGIVIILSKSFISYTTSGLENCITFLLLAIFYYYFFKYDKYSKINLTRLSLIASLSLVNRIDSILLFIPGLFYAFFYKREKGISFGQMILPGFLGMLPFILWELFTLIYYGFLFPNTAYAKLGTSIPEIQYIIRGIKYYIANFIYDPITLLSIFFIFIGCIMFKNLKNIIAFLGAIIYMLYILKIGGDFMNGRFFSGPLFLSLIVVANSQINYKKYQYFIYASVMLIMFQSVFNQVFENGDYGPLLTRLISGVANERAYYFSSTALKNNRHFQALKSSYLVIDGLNLKNSNTNVAIRYSTGFAGYYAGSTVKIIDGLALSDPLLTRMPTMNQTSTWRIGHIYREIPKGYIESLETRTNKIEDQNIKEFYDKILIITQGKIFSIKRIQTIINMNLGKYNYLIKR